MFKINRFDTVISTNDTASEKKYAHGDVIVAEYQSGGRGQRGNRWTSARGENLMFSVVLQPQELAAERQFSISQIVSLALVRALSEFGVEAAVKWPNDLYIGDRKVAGILIENDLIGCCITRSIIGIGLNVNQISFDPQIPNPTSLALSAGKTMDREAVFKWVLHHLAEVYSWLEARKFAEIEATYPACLYRKNGLHPFREPNGAVFRASIAEVLPDGELVLLRDDGFRKSYLFKEIEFVI